MKKRSQWWQWGIRAAVCSGLALLLSLGLFAVNGLSEGWREPEVLKLGQGEDGTRVKEVRVMAFNIAKAFVHQGGFQFAKAALIRKRLDEIARVIRESGADLVCLSEVVIEAGPAPVAQAQYLAQKCGFAYVATSENYSFGLPWYRIWSGNALLSRFPLKGREVVQLKGQKPIWNPTNNRRVLWCTVELGEAEWLIGSLRNDSFSRENNRVQMEEILKCLGDRPAILAGDFNADESSAAMKGLRDGMAFSGAFDGPPTHPANAPTRCIDYVLAPRTWQLVEHRVIETLVSDHLPVVSTFRLP